jgi:hypothetical protein
MSESLKMESHRPLKNPVATLEQHAITLEAAVEDLPDSLVKEEGLHAAWDARDLKEKFANGELSIEKVSKDLMLLYWINQDDITGSVIAGHMANIGRDFGHDAGMEFDQVFALWEEAKEESDEIKAKTQQSEVWTVIE